MRFMAARIGAIDSPGCTTRATGTPAVTVVPAVVGTYDLTETGPPGYDASAWQMIVAPAKTPKAGMSNVTPSLAKQRRLMVGSPRP